MSNKFKRFSLVNLANNTQTSILTVPTDTTAIVKSAIVANKSAGTRNVKMTYTPVTDSGTGTEVMLIPVEGVTANQSEDVLNERNPVVLEGNDILKFEINGTSADVTVNVLFVDRE
tara:strand:- start:27948 stop:28295 length:348 start_codon:yes stop_codon:yes gene_type:complete